MKALESFQARCRAAVAQRDITPPIGIYHRMWGAARHDRATGIHRPLQALVLAFESSRENTHWRRVVVGIDHCLMWQNDLRRLRSEVCQRCGVRDSELLVAFSHTHAAGLMDRNRADLPGGELIGPYLEQLAELIANGVSETLNGLRDAVLVYGQGRCNLAVNRDQWDEMSQQFVCGLNADGPSDDRLLVVRVALLDGSTLATVVNYACHPTTLAWENTWISPDYIGAMREMVEQSLGGHCLFLLGACGDLGPREGYVGNPKVADRNGRQLGHAALSALESLSPPGQRYAYVGPVVSGATLGDWRFRACSAQELASQSACHLRDWNIDVPYRAELPTVTQTRAEMARWQAAEETARGQGDDAGASDCRAHVERMNRQLTRIAQLPEGPTFPLPLSMWKLGDGYWVWLEGEYYSELQRRLRERFPDRPIIVATVVNGWRPAYLPTRETYGRGIYQEQVAVLAPGCLEQVLDAVAAQIVSWESSSTNNLADET